MLLLCASVPLCLCSSVTYFFNLDLRFSNCSDISLGSRSPKRLWCSAISSHSASHSSLSTLRMSFILSATPLSPLMSIASFSGSSPMGVSMAPAVPSARSKIHFSTRILSPYPGQRNLPSAPLRNQLTLNIFGSLVLSGAFAPIFTQCPK